MNDLYIHQLETENKQLRIALQECRKALEEEITTKKKAIEYIKSNTHKIEWGDIESQDEESIDINDDTTETEFIGQLFEILGDKENE